MLIDKSGITRLIPHTGAMCLLDDVLAWDTARIRCATGSHRLLSNPLRRNGQLGILCGVEYAAQAMALHGVLAGGGVLADAVLADGADRDPEQARAGYLASVRDLSCHGDRLDLLPGLLIVEAERLHGDADRAIYRFTLRHADRILINGRAAVALQKIAT